MPVPACPQSEPEATVGGWVMLGEDHDCETCGGSYNSVEWDFDGSEFTLTSSVGCYGGAFLTTPSPAAAAEFVRALGERFPGAVTALRLEADLILKVA